MKILVAVIVSQGIMVKRKAPMKTSIVSIRYINPATLAGSRFHISTIRFVISIPSNVLEVANQLQIIEV